MLTQVNTHSHRRTKESHKKIAVVTAMMAVVAAIKPKRYSEGEFNMLLMARI
jgi:hypothetical protein